MEEPVPMTAVVRTLACVLLLTLWGCATQVAPIPESAPDIDSVVGNQLGLKPLNRQNMQSTQIAHVDIPVDLFERIRRGFAMPDLQNELVSDRERWYADRPDYIERMAQRSSKYLYHIVEEIEQRGMPTELALLPFVESAFNPQAVSSAKASGMWQFMPATGRDFDLKQNVFRDDRRDIQASTRAALDYLQRLHDQFGDWHLALAAYNWGEGNVAKAIARNQKQGLDAGYVDLTMPMETRFYVPKLQAIKNIVAQPQQFQVKLPVVPNHPYFQGVPLPRDMDVSMAAKLAEISVEDFRALNPSAHRPVLLAAGHPLILLPWDNAEIFQRNYEALGGGRLASWTAWVAPRTMKAAEAAKRVGMSEAEFRQVNNIPTHMMVKAGAVVLVPRTGSLDRDVDAALADRGQLSLAAEPPPKVTTKSSKKTTAKAKGTGKSKAGGKAQASAQGPAKQAASTKSKSSQPSKEAAATVTAQAAKVSSR
jgi:membrane-bound lytic murein transglycosylase D